ncbi:MAG: ABC transporter permease [Bacteroidota bacterium]
MIYNYIKLSFRSILKHRSFSAINIVGLAIGIAACLLLAQYAYLQHSYDDFHENADRIYRLENRLLVEGGDRGGSISIDYELTNAINAAMPQIESMARFDNIDYINNTMIYKGPEGVVSYNESGVYITDKSTFDIFNFEFAYGNASRFDEPDKIILSHEIAKKYFPQGDGLGKKVTLSGNIGAYDYEVVGVLKPLPPNTHFEFSLLLSLDSQQNYTGEDIRTAFFTYIMLKEGVETEGMVAQLESVGRAHYADRLSAAEGEFYMDMQPLNKLQLYYPQYPSFKKAGDLKTVNILVIIAIIILLIAWFNYINLSTVKAIERAKEIGIRKVLGSQKKHILWQFVIESLLINIVAAMIAFTIVQISVPLMKTYLDFPVSFTWDFSFWALIILMLLAGSLISAVYPASIMMGFSPLSILSKRIALSHGGVGFRKILVVTQFVISVMLIGATMTVYRQVSFMSAADLGINIDNIVVLKSPPGDLTVKGNNFFEALGTFKNELERNNLISVMTSSSAVPGRPITWGTSMKRLEQTEKERVDMMLIAVGDRFDEAYKLELIAGRLLRKGDNPWSNGHIVINEEAARQLGFASPEAAIGERVDAPGSGTGTLVIKGVVGNHNHQSLRSGYLPITYMPSVWANYYSVKLNISPDLSPQDQLGQVKAGVDLVRDKWEEFFPFATMDYFFLDEDFDNQYKNDRQFGLIFGLFAGLAIIIASLGLLGLSSFAIARRTKEIGVRKVLGASDAHVVRILSREYIVLIIVANLIAVPLAWYFLSQWLSGYHFRIELGWWLAFIPMAIVFTIAIATIGIKVLKVAGSNPVHSLRYE